MPEKHTDPRPIKREIDMLDMALRGHDCFACLSGRNAEKQACAIRRLLLAGFGEAHVLSVIPSSKIEH